MLHRYDEDTETQTAVFYPAIEKGGVSLIIAFRGEINDQGAGNTHIICANSSSNILLFV